MAGPPVVDPKGDEYQRANGLIQKAQTRLDKRTKSFERRAKIWLGETVPTNQTAAWRSNVFPKYVYARVDVLLANILAEPFSRRVTANRPDHEQTARLIERALGQVAQRDERDRKEEEMLLQALVMGYSPAKVTWLYQQDDDPRLAQNPASMRGVQTAQLPGQGKVTLHDESTMTVIPVQDFALDPSASGIKDAAFATHRTWQSMDQLRAGQAAGYFENVDRIEAVRGGGNPQASISLRSIQLPSIDQAVELIEVWERGRVTTIANRQTVIRYQESPFWHRQLPFTICSTMPNLYSYDEVSNVDLLGDLQELAWMSGNQRVDAGWIASSINMILDRSTPELEKIANGYDPRGGINLFPLDSPSEANWFVAPTSPMQAALEAERAVKDEMDDLAATSAYVSGAGVDTVDPKTATEVQTFANAAQVRIKRMRTRAAWALQDVGVLEVKLMRQFANKPMMVKMGDSADQWEMLDPQAVADADVCYSISEAGETTDRQQRRVEAQAFSDEALAINASSPTGPIVDMRVVWRKFARSFGEQDPDSFLLPEPAPPVLPALGGTPVPGQMAGAAPDTPQPGPGVAPQPPPTFSPIPGSMPARTT